MKHIKQDLSWHKLLALQVKLIIGRRPAWDSPAHNPLGLNLGPLGSRVPEWAIPMNHHSVKLLHYIFVYLLGVKGGWWGGMFMIIVLAYYFQSMFHFNTSLSHTCVMSQRWLLPYIHTKNHILLYYWFHPLYGFSLRGKNSGYGKRQAEDDVMIS